MSAACYDCGRPYGEKGFEDLVIPNWAWRRISPCEANAGGGLLCACCISARLTKAGIRCEGAFLSGPVETVSPRLMEALARCENIEERMERLASVDTQPEAGDVKQAPLVSGAVPKADAQPSVASPKRGPIE